MTKKKKKKRKQTEAIKLRAKDAPVNGRNRMAYHAYININILKEVEDNINSSILISNTLSL